MRGRHVCIKWDMTVMEMTWILRQEKRGSNEGKNNGGLLRLQVWSAAGGLEARQSRAEVRSAHPAWWSQPQVVRSPQGSLKLDHSSRRLQLLLQALIFLPPDVPISMTALLLKWQALCSSVQKEKTGSENVNMCNSVITKSEGRWHVRTRFCSNAAMLFLSGDHHF